MFNTKIFKFATKKRNLDKISVEYVMVKISIGNFTDCLKWYEMVLRRLVEHS